VCGVTLVWRTDRKGEQEHDTAALASACLAEREVSSSASPVTVTVTSTPGHRFLVPDAPAGCRAAAALLCTHA
jgi:hypothetical protein